MNSRKLQYVRYILEMIAFPFFAFLVFHFAAHGTKSLVTALNGQNFLENFEWFPMAMGIILLGLFFWAWQQPALKRLTPCAHEHCHPGTKYLHVFAIVAFCMHFFPEAILRHELIQNLFAENSSDKIIGFSALLGFATHFIIDVITAISLSSYWKENYQKILSILIIVGIWLAAFFLQTNIFHLFPAQFEGIILLLGAFVLAMFVHFPHKPITKCSSCAHG